LEEPKRGGAVFRSPCHRFADGSGIETRNFDFGKRRNPAYRPKASVQKDDLSLLGEKNIWLSRKVGNVEPEFVSAGPGYFPHQEFRFCVFATDERHPLAALRPRERIHFPL